MRRTLSLDCTVDRLARAYAAFIETVGGDLEIGIGGDRALLRFGHAHVLADGSMNRQICQRSTSPSRPGAPRQNGGVSIPGIQRIAPPPCGMMKRKFGTRANRSPSINCMKAIVSAAMWKLPVAWSAGLQLPETWIIAGTSNSHIAL